MSVEPFSLVTFQAKELIGKSLVEAGLLVRAAGSGVVETWETVLGALKSRRLARQVRQRRQTTLIGSALLCWISTES